MTELPLPVQQTLRRLSRRLALGLFLQVWPPWAAGSLLAAGAVALIGRLFVPQTSSVLAWLWLAPVVAAVPAGVIAWRRAYLPQQVAALADVMAGGDGVLLASLERPAAGWSDSVWMQRVAALEMPRLDPWRRLRFVPLAAVFFAVVLLLPQRALPGAGDTALADQIASGLEATVTALEAQQLISPEEEKTFEEEIERIRRAARERMDAGAWEAADAMRERLAAEVAGKQDALAWAQESLARYAAAAQSAQASGGTPSADAARELMDALQKLQQAGLLAGAPSAIANLANGRGGMPGDAASLAQMGAMLEQFLQGRGSRAGQLALAGRGRGGRLDSDEFPLAAGTGEGSGNRPGRGGVNRGRADAELTWGQETQPVDRFKPQALPPGFARGPDDFAPVSELPGAPQVAPRAGGAAAARQYDGGAGQEAWRRSLAPRHQSAVRKYFEVNRR